MACNKVNSQNSSCSIAQMLELLPEKKNDLALGEAMCFEQNLVPVGSCTTSRRNPLFRALSRIRERSVAFELASQLSRARRRAVQPSQALYSHPSSALSLSRTHFHSLLNVF